LKHGGPRKLSNKKRIMRKKVGRVFGRKEDNEETRVSWKKLPEDGDHTDRIRSVTVRGWVPKGKSSHTKRGVHSSGIRTLGGGGVRRPS